MAFDAYGGVGMAASGAAMGSMIMPGIGTAIGAVAGFAVGGLFGGGGSTKAEARAINAQSALRLKAIEAQALEIRKDMARNQGETRRMRTMEILNTANAIQYIKRNSGQIKADISVQNASADAIGASALAAHIDAQQQEDIGKAEAIRALEYNIANQGALLDSQLNQAEKSTRGMVEQFRVQQRQGRESTQKADLAKSLISLGTTVGSAWASGAFSSAGGVSNSATSSAGLSGGYGLSKQSVSGLRYGGR